MPISPIAATLKAIQSEAIIATKAPTTPKPIATAATIVMTTPTPGMPTTIAFTYVTNAQYTSATATSPQEIATSAPPETTPGINIIKYQHHITLSKKVLRHCAIQKPFFLLT